MSEKEKAKKRTQSPPLEFATNQELIDEIGRRAEAYVVLTLEVPRNQADQLKLYYAYDGGFHTALGMVTEALERMKQDIDFGEKHG